MESSQKFPLTKQIIRDLYLVFLSVQWCISTLAYGLYFICRFALKNMCKFIFLVFSFFFFFIVRAYAVIPCIHTNISVSFGCHLCQWWCVPSRQNSCLLQVTGTTKCVFLRCTFQPGSCLFQVEGRLKSAFLSPLLFSPVAHRGGCDKEKGTQADC